MQYSLFRCIVTGLVSLTIWLALARDAHADPNALRWAKVTLEAFESYCFRTEANPARIEALAKISRLDPIPADIVEALLGANSTSGAGYVVESDRDAGVMVAMVYGRPAACSVAVDGINYAPIRETLRKAMQLVLMKSQSIGVQTTELYVPGGTTGSRQEAMELGLISLSFPNPGFGDLTLSVGYLPPGTVAPLFDD